MTIRINEKEVVNSFKAISKEARLLRKDIANMTIGSAEYNKTAAELRKVDDALRNHRKNIKSIPGGYGKLSGAIGKFIPLAAAAFSAQQIIGYGKELFRLGTEMEVLTRKAQTVFGEALPQVTEAAEQNAAAMGLTVSQYTDASAAIGDLLIPMGFQREEAANISTELVDLSGALSEWTGGQIEATEVTKILGKAVLGEREQLKTLGISIQEADVKARLADKGLTGLTGTMLQQAKAAVTLELITEKSADAQAAFAANADTNIRTQAELNAKFTDIQETLATALVPVFGRLLQAALPVVESFTDFVKQVADGGKPVGNFGKVLTLLGNSLALVWSVLKPVGETLFSISSGIVDFMIPVWEQAAITFTQFTNGIKSGINTISDFLGLDTKFELIDVDALKAQLKAAEQVVEKSDIDKKIQKKFTPPQILSTSSEDPKAAKALEKKAEQEAKALEKRLQRLRDIEKKFSEEARLNQLSEDEQAIERIKAKYDKEIEIANQSGAEGIEIAKNLERLKETELAELRTEIAEKNRKDFEAARDEHEAEKAAAQAEIDAATREVLLSEQEQTLFDLEEHYRKLTEQATKYGIDTSKITEAYEKEKADIVKEQADKALKTEQEAYAKRTQLLANAFKGVGEVISATFDLLGDQAGENNKLQKAAALAQIAFDTAAAISSLTRNSQANPANAFTGGLAGVAQFASGLAQILGNIKRAKDILSSAPPVQQKFTGGWTDAVGATDNKTYRAKFLGRVGSGMLPGHPSLILGSERGREYFVANDDLKNPRVLNHVQAIDNIAKGKTRQFFEGGFTNQPPTENRSSSEAENGSAMNGELIALLKDLRTILSGGIDAVIDDETVIDIRKRFKQLNSASGGALN